MKYAAILALCIAPMSVEAALDIYWIDTEGGASTLVVSDSGESLLMDAGYAGFDDRDVDRVAAVVREVAKLDHIDYFLTSHFHGDHVGGLFELSKRIEIGRFIDHGDSVDQDGDEGKAIWEAYRETAGSKRQSVVPDDKLAFDGVEIVFVASDGNTLSKPLPGAGAANDLCASYEPRPDDQGENGRSLGYLLKAGAFDFVNLGDLPWSRQHRLACPANLLGEVDLFQATHHGVRDDVLPQQVGAIRPTVTVMNNGPTKGAGRQAVANVLGAPGLQDFWQLHRALGNDDAHNASPELTANLSDTDSCEGHWLHARVEDDGRFTLTNSRNGFSKSYDSK